MRILIWTDAIWPEIGGLENFCLHLAQGLQARGHEILVVTERKEGCATGWSMIGKLPVFGVCFELAAKEKDMAGVRRQHDICREVISQWEPDVIHLNTVMRGALGFLLQQRSCRSPAVMTLHDNLFPRYESGMAPAVLKNVDAIVAVSDFVKRNATESRPALTHKLCTILNAVPVPALLPAPLPIQPCLLAYGRLVREKGFDLAIEAFQMVAPEFPGLTLTIAGDGREAANLRRLATRSKYSGRIIFPGWVAREDIPALINKHTAVLMPSRWREPFGLVALEAAQMARPIVAAATGALPEIVLPDVTGFLFECENVEALARAIRNLLALPDGGRACGQRARTHVRKNFNFDDFLASYEALYMTIVSRAGDGQTVEAM